MKSDDKRMRGHGGERDDPVDDRPDPHSDHYGSRMDFGTFPLSPGGYGLGPGGLGTGLGGPQLFGRQAQGFANAPSDAHRDSYSGVGPKNYRRADDRIIDDICERLTMHPGLDASGMNVDVKEGVVTLNGTVRDRRDRWVAEDLVDRVAGVRDIDNRLKVDRR